MSTRTHSEKEAKKAFQGRFSYFSGGLQILTANRKITVSFYPSEGIHVDCRSAFVLSLSISNKPLKNKIQNIILERWRCDDRQGQNNETFSTIDLYYFGYMQWVGMGENCSNTVHVAYRVWQNKELSMVTV